MTDDKKQSRLYRELGVLLSQHNARSADGSKKVSFETRSKRQKVLIGAFRTLHEIGYSIQSPQNLRPKHIHALGRELEVRGLSASTIQNTLSVLRVFCEWIGKPGMIKSPVEYVDHKDSVTRHYKADKDKSWSAHQLDVDQFAVKAASIEPRCGIYIHLAVKFGLRKLECISLRPHRADRGDHLYILDGTKGGRPRIIPIQTQDQRDLIDQCKRLAGANINAHVGIPNKTKEQALNRFEYVLRKLGITKKDEGVTLHGLRHQYINDRLAELGVQSPVRGGDLKEQKKADEETVQHAQRIVAEEVGHSRVGIMSSYSG